jgi:hypothetical protein
MSTNDPQASFESEEVSRYSQINAQGMALGFLALAKKYGESPESATRWLGAIFAPAWQGLQHEGAFAVARLAALNMVSVGVPLKRLAGDEHRAEASFGKWPSDGDMDHFGLSQDDVEAVYAIFEPIVTSLGLRYQWERADDEFAITVEAAES